ASSLRPWPRLRLPRARSNVRSRAHAVPPPSQTSLRERERRRPSPQRWFLLTDANHRSTRCVFPDEWAQPALTARSYVRLEASRFLPCGFFPTEVLPAHPSRA